MVGFKANLGPRSGGTVRYMGAVEKYEIRGEDGGERWDDSALVQYDSVWHFAYMLSTDVYRGLNEEKVRGVEDTGILLISEGGGVKVCKCREVVSFLFFLRKCQLGIILAGGFSPSHSFQRA